MHDRVIVNPGDGSTAGESELRGIHNKGVINLSFQQHLELKERKLTMLELGRQMKQEEREAEREKDCIRIFGLIVL